MVTTKRLQKLCLIGATALSTVSVTGISFSSNAKAQGPSLIVTNAPLPDDLRRKVYRTPRQQSDITTSQISGAIYTQSGDSLITGKITELRTELAQLQARVDTVSGGLTALQANAENLAAQYYANVATINTQLQSGTTPGNPRLVRRLSEAQRTLEGLSENVARLNEEAVQISSLAADNAFLLDAARATYGLHGAIEEDHVILTELEDQINGTMIIVDRMLNSANEDIARTAVYLSSERENLRTLSLAVSNGHFYGSSFTNRSFTNANIESNSHDGATVYKASVNNSDRHLTTSGTPEGRKPLVQIKFDRANVEFEQSLYVAVNEALQRYPNAQFDLVAVYPSEGNTAKIAIETTRARRNAEKVLRTLDQMGVPQERIDLSYDQNAQANASEVHVYIK